MCKKRIVSNLHLRKHDILTSPITSFDSQPFLDEISVENWADLAPDETQLAALKTRFALYGDLTQNARTEPALAELLSRTGNDTAKVLAYLKAKRARTGVQVFIPPAITDEKGQSHQLPAFEMPIYKGEEINDE